jgi:hypothetical protein
MPREIVTTVNRAQLAASQSGRQAAPQHFVSGTTGVDLRTRDLAGNPIQVQTR